MTQLRGESGHGPFVGSVPRILYVEDDDLVRRAFERSMRRPGLEIDVARSGAEALAMTRERAYDVVVTDLSMPGMDGVALIEKLAERGDDLGFVVVSGHGELHVLGKCQLLALDVHVVAKPWDVRELSALLLRIARERTRAPAA